MRLIVECEHGAEENHPTGNGVWSSICYGAMSLTDPAAILAALAEAGVLKVERAVEGWGYYGQRIARYVSPWKESK